MGALKLRNQLFKISPYNQNSTESYNLWLRWRERMIRESKIKMHLTALERQTFHSRQHVQFGLTTTLNWHFLSVRYQ